MDETDVCFRSEEEIPELRPHYVRYRALERQLARWSAESRTDGDGIVRPRTLRGNDGDTPASLDGKPSFVEQYKLELDRVHRFVSTSLEGIGMNLSSILEALSTADGRPTSIETVGIRHGDGHRPWDLDDLRKRCNELCRETDQLEAFSVQNAAAFARLAKMHDERLASAPGEARSEEEMAPGPRAGSRASELAEEDALLPVFLDWFDREFVRAAVFDGIVVMLSDVFAELREAEEERQREENSESSQEWVPPESFERKTTKYWVHPRHVLRVKLLVVRHLPVLIFGSNRAKRTARVSEPKLSFFHRDKIQDSQDISSVYFDNPALDAYHRRLVREDMSSLLRIRWYGDRRPGDGEKELFVERKVHRNSWTGHSSCKERVSICQAGVSGYIAGENIPEIEKNTERNVGFLKQVQATILDEGQRPMIRTCYRRTAFQLSTSNTVRISLDTDLRMVDESRARVAKGDWCRDLSLPVYESESVMFPYAILEIKLQTEEQPEWIQQLLATGMLVEAPKFSKFQHAMAMLHSDRVRQLPYWFAGPLPSEGGARGSHLTIEEMARSNDACGYELRSVELDVNGDIHRAAKRVNDMLKRKETDAAVPEGYPLPMLEQDLWVACQRTIEWLPTADVDERIMKSGIEEAKGNFAGPGSHPDGSDISETTCSKPALAESVDVSSLKVGTDVLGPDPSAMLPVDAVVMKVKDENEVSRRSSGRRFFLHSMSSARTPRDRDEEEGGGGASGKKIPSMVRTRVEPKTFFANERTFLSWLSISVLVMFTSLSLLNGSSLGSTGGSSSVSSPPLSDSNPFAALDSGEHSSGGSKGLSGGQISGIVIAPLAILFMVYALYMYRLRTKQILLRQTVRYDDQRGPVGLVILLIGVTITSYVVSILYVT